MVYIDGVVFTLQTSGGISVYFAEILKALVLRGVDHKVGLYGNSNNILKEYELNTNLKRHSRFLERYRDVENDISDNINVFHSSYYRLPKDKKGKRVITTVHDFTYEKYIGGLSAKIHHLQKKRAILNSDSIVCISENTKKDMYTFVPESRSKHVTVIPNGVSESYYCKGHQGFDNYVLFVGARSGYKNFQVLLEAMKLLPDMNLVTVGGGAYSKEELTQLDKFLPNRYSHYSYLVNDDLNNLYNSACCLVYPSLYEGFGIPVLEAMKAGCPVIASNTSSLPEVCGEGGVLLDNMTPINICESIMAFKDPVYRKRYVNRGIKQSQDYTWSGMCDSLFELYRSC